jgi:hypothetical protein
MARCSIIDPNKLLETSKEVIIIDLLDKAMNLKDEQLKALIDPPRGIYIKGSLKPYIVEGKRYFPKSIFELSDDNVIRSNYRFNIEEVLTFKEDIYDEEGNVVISEQLLKTKSKYMSLSPDIPVIAIEVAVVLVVNYLNNICPYTRGVRTNCLENLIRPEYSNYITTEEYESAYEKLLNTVFEFVGIDTWFIYFHRLKGTSLIIEKVIDYRIYRYHEIMYEEQCSDSLSNIY